MSELLPSHIHRAIEEILEWLKRNRHLGEEENNMLKIWEDQLFNKLKTYASNDVYSDRVSLNVYCELARLDLLAPKNNVSPTFATSLLSRRILTLFCTMKFLIPDGGRMSISPLFAIDEILKRLQSWQVRRNSFVCFCSSTAHFVSFRCSLNLTSHGHAQRHPRCKLIDRLVLGSED